jgi:hypothetical protein
MTRTSGEPATALLVALAFIASSCGGGSNLTELQRVKADDLDVVMLSPRDALRHGNDTFVIEFRSGSGQLIDVGDVKASATMPMPGASPMFGRIDVKRTAVAGRYEATAQFDMAGTWRSKIEWNGARGSESVTFSGAVQ